MTDTGWALSAARWDEEYRSGRYASEPPLAFVQRIISTLNARPAIRKGPGLYVGCGNGRNYLPLLDAGLELYGVDVAPEALRALADRRPDASHRLLCDDFAHFRSSLPLGYLIATPVFGRGELYGPAS